MIPVERTAVPVEWDEVKTQLMRLATDLGPKSGVSGTSVGRFIDSAANALDGNGDKLRQTLGQLSGVGRILANGSGNIVDIIKNLQTFVTALRDSNIQIVQFNDRLATLTSVVNDSKSDLDAALTDLSTAVGEVQRFIAGTRNQTSEQIARLADVTQILVDHAHGSGKHSARRAERARQLLQRLQRRHRNHRGRVRDHEFRESHVGGLVLLLPFRAARKSAPSRTSPRSNRASCAPCFSVPGCGCSTSITLPIPINPFMPKSIDPSQDPLHRTAPGARRRGPETRSTRDPARSVGLHRPAG